MNAVGHARRHIGGRIAVIAVTGVLLSACGGASGAGSSASGGSGSGGDKSGAAAASILAQQKVDASDLGSVVTAAMRRAGSAHFTTTSTGAAMATSTAVGVLRFTAGGVDGSATVTDNGGATVYDLILVNNTIYQRRVKDPTNGPSGWLNYGKVPDQMTMDNAKAYGYGNTIKAVGLGTFFASAGYLYAGGRETVEGVPATKYTTALARRTLSDQDKAATQAELRKRGLGPLGPVGDELAAAAVGSDLSIVLWIDEHGLPVTVASSVMVVDSALNGVTTYSGWGQNVTVTTPSGATSPGV